MHAVGQLHICGTYRFPARIGVTESCLGKRYSVKIGGQRATLSLPKAAWGQGKWGKDAPSLVAPSSGLRSVVDDSIARIATRAEESEDILDFWGMIGGHRQKTHRVTGAFVAAGLLSFVPPASGITFSEYTHGLGAPQGPKLSELFDNIDHWFDLLRTWIELFGGQDLDADHPLSSAGRAGNGLTLLAFDGTDVSLPGENTTMKIIVRQIAPLTLGRLQRAIRLANADATPSDSWLLLRDAFGSHRRLRYRRAVIEAGTAVELTLADFNSKGPKLKPRRGYPTLGWLVGKLKAKAKLPAGLSTDLVDRRNAAIHKNRTPTLEQSWTSLDLAKQVLELHDPLPGS